MFYQKNICGCGNDKGKAGYGENNISDIKPVVEL